MYYTCFNSVYQQLVIVSCFLRIADTHNNYTHSGRTLSLQTLVTGSPSYGFQLLLDEGEKCEVTGKPRRTLVTFPCDPTPPSSDGLAPLEAYEGKGKDVCHYYMVFSPSQLGCPVHQLSITDSAHIINIESGEE